MTNESEKSNRDLDELLPFYVAGTLNSDEVSRVEAYLAANETARKEVDVLRSIQETVKSQTFPQSPGEFGFKRLEKLISEEPQIQASNDNIESWWRPVGIAASFAAAFFALIAVQDLTPQPGGFITASGPINVTGPLVQVMFQPDVTEAEIRSFFLEKNLVIVNGPSAIGLYYVEYGVEDAGQQELEALIKDLRSQVDVISSADLD